MGNCGGPLSERLVQIDPARATVDGSLDGARMRSGRVELSGDRVLRPSIAMEGDVVTSCPVAAIDKGDGTVGVILQAFRFSETGQLATIYPEPSAALVEAVDLVGIEVGRMRKWEHETRPKSGAGT